MKQEAWWKNLQPLRVCPCWELVWNKLLSLEPEACKEDDAAWQFTFVQDILYMRKRSGDQMVHLDLGWYPDGDPDGSYRLVAILNDDWLFECIPTSQPVDEKSFRRRHPNKR